MDNLKDLISKKKKSFTEETGGRKYAKRSEIEENRLKRIREEEEAERVRKQTLKVRAYPLPLDIVSLTCCNEPIGIFAWTQEACIGCFGGKS